MSKKIIGLLIFFMSVTTGYAKSFNNVDWMQGSWGVRLYVRGGSTLNTYVDTKGYNYVVGAQEIVESYPTMEYVITNFTNNANSSLFLLRTNENVDAVMGASGSVIYEEFVPSEENEQIIIDVINVFKDAGKKVILYLNTQPISNRTSDDSKTAWLAYVDEYFDGDVKEARINLLEGYVKRFAEIGIDGYWLDAVENSDETIELIDMIREHNPNIAIGANVTKSYLDDVDGSKLQVDSDGLDDDDETDYKVISYEGNDAFSDFTSGHITPLGQGAPPNSWAYEEFTIPAIQQSSSDSYDGSKLVLKHMFVPIRSTWSSERSDLMFDKEQAYRFVKNITDAGGAITFSTTTDTDGTTVEDEEEILKYVNDMLEEDYIDFTPYSRPEGAWLVGEEVKAAQSITFPELPSKAVGDADFSPGATASSGLTVTYVSSNPEVAVIENNKISIVGAGTTRIRARQLGDDEYRQAPLVTQFLTVEEGSTSTGECILPAIHLLLSEVQ
jgi:hypothetical protein